MGNPNSIASATPASRAGESGPPRLVGLDILRFAAICLVICRHVTPQSQMGLGNFFMKLGIRVGWAGVDLFFVLSGFLVSGLLFKEYKERRSVRIWRFLLRRGWRIYPPFWIMVCASVLLWDFHLWDGFSRRGLLGEALFIQNYIGGLWMQTWSLGVEEHFYLFLAGIVYLLSLLRRGKAASGPGPFSSIPAIIGAIAVVCLSLRIFVAHRLGNYQPMKLLYPSHLRLDSLAAGVLLSYWWHLQPGEPFRKWVSAWRVPLVIFGAALFIPIFIWDVDKDVWVPVFGVNLLYCGSSLLLLGVLSFPSLQLSRTSRFLGYLGSHSYSVYLWHGIWVAFCVSLIRGWFKSSWGDGLEVATCFVGTWVLGLAAATFCEFPLLKLRDRYTSRPTSQPLVPVAAERANEMRQESAENSEALGAAPSSAKSLPSS